MMELLRDTFTQARTLGELYIDGEFVCDTLEDKVRDPSEAKVPRETAIPPGIYEVIVNESTRFKRLMPLLLNVPNFSGIRIHPGNTEADTEGCILVGERTENDTSIINSLKTYEEKVYPMIVAAILKGALYIDVRNA